MDFFLQQGWGMMELDKEFLKKDLASGVILTPRVHKPEQVERHSKEIRKLGGELLFDPQFYLPRTRREKLLTHSYWDDLNFDTSTFDEGNASKFCEDCVKHQRSLNVSKVLLPGRYSNSVDDSWLEMHHNFAEKASSLDIDVPIYSTIALGPDVISSDEAFSDIVDEVVNYPVDGIYFVFKHPNNNFLVEEELALYYLLNRFLDIRLSKKDIILGYSNQQSLIFAVAGVKNIASGNFRNTRHFDPSIFDVQEDEMRKRATWYYDANTLSEFRIESMSLAFRRNLQGYFGPVCEYCRPLLESADPASFRWSESLAFRHFLHEIRRQWLELESSSMDLVIEKVMDLINRANSILDQLSSRGFYTGNRSFKNTIDPTLSALKAFISDRGRDIKRL